MSIIVAQIQSRLLSDAAGASRGLAYVAYGTPSEALRAYECMDGAAFHGRVLHILPANTAPDRGLTSRDVTTNRATSAYALRKVQKRSAEVDRDFNWSSLYLDVSVCGHGDLFELGTDGLCNRL